MHLLSARSDSISTDNLPQGSSQCLFLIPKALLPSTIIFLGFLENFDNSNKFNVFLNELCFTWVYFYSKKTPVCLPKNLLLISKNCALNFFNIFEKFDLNRSELLLQKISENCINKICLNCNFFLKFSYELSYFFYNKSLQRSSQKIIEQRNKYCWQEKSL